MGIFDDFIRDISPKLGINQRIALAEHLERKSPASNPMRPQHVKEQRSVSIKELLNNTKTPGFFSRDDEPGKTTGWVPVVESGVMDQTDLDTGEVVYWDAAKTRAKKLIFARVQTSLRESADDDGIRAIYFSGQKFTALQNAIKAAGSDDLVAGDTLNVTYTGRSDRAPSNKAYDRAKLFTVEYVKGSGTTEALASPKSDGPARPDSIPANVWDAMPPEARAAVVASLGTGPV